MKYKRKFTFFLFWLFLIFIINNLFSFNNKYYVLVDTSGSMIGLPVGSGNKNIFPEVKSQIIDFINSLESGTYVKVLSFDKRINNSIEGIIGNNEEKTKIINFIRSLEAKGVVTHIYDSLMSLTNKILAENKSSNALITIMLFTDGHDTSPNHYTIEKILNDFNLKAAEYGHLYLTYISLGHNKSILSTQEKSVFKKYRKHVKLVDIKNADEIRKFPKVEIKPYFLNFSYLEKGVSREREIKVFYKNVNNVLLRMVPECSKINKQGSALDIQPETISINGTGKTVKKIKIRLLNYDSVRDGNYECRIKLDINDERTLINTREIIFKFSLFEIGHVKIISQELKKGKLFIGKISFPPLNKSRNEEKRVESVLKLEFDNKAIEKGLFLMFKFSENSPFFLYTPVAEKKTKVLKVKADNIIKNVKIISVVKGTLKGNIEDDLEITLPTGLVLENGDSFFKGEKEGLYKIKVMAKVSHQFDYDKFKNIITVVLIVFGLIFIFYMICWAFISIKIPKGTKFYLRELSPNDDGRIVDVKEVVDDLSAKEIKPRKCKKWLIVGSGVGCDLDFSNEPFVPWIKIKPVGEKLEWVRHENLDQDFKINDSEEEKNGFLSNGDIIKVGNRILQFIVYKENEEVENEL